MLALGKVTCAWRVILAFPSVVNMLGLRDGEEVRYGLKANVSKFIWL